MYKILIDKSINGFLAAQSEKEKDTKRGVAVDRPAEGRSIAAGAKIGAAAAERSAAAAGTGRAGTAGAPPGTTRNTGQGLQGGATAGGLLL